MIGYILGGLLAYVLLGCVCLAHADKDGEFYKDTKNTWDGILILPFIWPVFVLSLMYYHRRKDSA